MKKILRAIFLIGVFLSSSLLLTGCGDDLVLVTGVDLYINEIHANVNESVDLSYKVYPSNATNKKVTFWSTDENIAEVDQEGKVTIKSRGEASIVVRSVDGGYEDYCKIVTNIDPDELSWDYGDKISKVTSADYSGETTMALNQVMKLKVVFMQEGQESEIVTNKDVTFTSSNPTNIQVINDKEGIIKACHDAIIDGDRAYSDITATLKIKDGKTLKTTCRVYITKSSSLEKLCVQYVNGGSNVLDERNGSETVYLTAATGGGAPQSVEFYAYISNISDEILNDYDISLSNGIEGTEQVPLYTYELTKSPTGIHKFTLTPGEIEGTGTLYIKTTCTDESGKLIRANINVTVQAEIMKVEANATTRHAGIAVDDQTEVLLADEIFSLELTYFDSQVDGQIIEGAQRQLYFDFDKLDEVQYNNLFKYIAYYGNNQFKVINVPDENSNDTPLSIPCYIYKNENIMDETSSNKIEFDYYFHIRNSLESLIVLTEPKSQLQSANPSGEVEIIPVVGVSDITISQDGILPLYAYATTYNITDTDATKVAIDVEDTTICIGQSAGGNTFYITGESPGDTVVTFSASDGITTLEYKVNVHVVANVAEINLYEDIDFTSKLETTEYTVPQGIDKLYIKIDAINGQIVENESNFALKVKIGVNYVNDLIKTEVVEVGDGNNKTYFVCRYIDLTRLESGINSITIEAERVLASREITIKK